MTAGYSFVGRPGQRQNRRRPAADHPKKLPAMQISVSGRATTAEDIRRSADAIITAAQL